MQLWKPTLLLLTFAVATSSVLAEGSQMEDGSGQEAGSGMEAGSGQEEGSGQEDSGAVGGKNNENGGVPAPATGSATRVTWQTTVAGFAATAAAIALV